MTIQGKAFFKEAPVIATTTPKRKTTKIAPGEARLIPDHPMSVIDSYLYSFGSNEPKSMRIGDMGALEIGLGGNYKKDLNDIVHVHTAMSFYYKDSTLYINPNSQ